MVMTKKTNKEDYKIQDISKQEIESTMEMCQAAPW